jgi:hypothetical protein
MIRHFAMSVLMSGALAASVSAQSRTAATAQYDPNAEATFGGVITQVISVVGPDGTVGVHLNLKTGTGQVVRVHVGPAMFIGMNNFSFFTDEQILVTGPIVSHAGDSAVWARQITKGSKTLTLRSPDGSPRWPYATAEDPDGCGISHDVVRY